MSSDDEVMDCDAEDVDVDALDKTNHVLPAVSSNKYKQVYLKFQEWNKSNGTSIVSEDILLKYFEELAEKSKPTSLFAIYSMLKATCRLNDNVDLGTHKKLLDFLKKKSVGYTPLSSKTFTEDDIKKFVNEAPDDRYLDIKVVCIFVVCGVHSARLYSVMMEHVKLYDDLILLTMPKTDTTSQFTLTITGTFFYIVRKYIELRQKKVIDGPLANRFFIQYRDGKFRSQIIGKSKFYQMPRQMASYLKLPEPNRYTGLSFRKSTASISASLPPCNSTDEQVTELDYQTGQLKTTSYTVTRPFLPPTNRRNGTDHVCTLSCGQVKCALDENEESARHAFTVMTPPKYIITDITPAIYPLEPSCQWIVAYKHKTHPVTDCNADKTFEDIIRSIPNNVRINQQYIRRCTSYVSAAYVVVYGVNCKCQREATNVTDIFNFSVNELKNGI